MQTRTKTRTEHTHTKHRNGWKIHGRGTASLFHSAARRRTASPLFHLESEKRRQGTVSSLFLPTKYQKKLRQRKGDFSHLLHPAIRRWWKGHKGGGDLTNLMQLKPYSIKSCILLKESFPSLSLPLDTSIVGLYQHLVDPFRGVFASSEACLSIHLDFMQRQAPQAALLPLFEGATQQRSLGDRLVPCS